MDRHLLAQLPLLCAVLCLGYLSGSVPYGVLIARRRGVDLRSVGSGNIGATNAARALGKGWGALVLALDAAKATLPIFLIGALCPDEPRRTYLQVGVATGAFLGHLFPVFLRFRGGKGVATAFGAFLGLLPAAALLGLGTYALSYGTTRISSVGSLSAVLLFPLWLYLLGASPPLWVFAGFVFCLILVKHRGNIRRLLQKQEDRI